MHIRTCQSKLEKKNVYLVEVIRQQRRFHHVVPLAILHGEVATVKAEPVRALLSILLTITHWLRKLRPVRILYLHFKEGIHELFERC